MWTCASHNAGVCCIPYDDPVLLYHASATSELSEQGAVPVPNVCFWVMALVAMPCIIWYSGFDAWRCQKVAALVIVLYKCAFCI